MQIVIDIPEEIIEWINGYYNFIKCFNGEKIGIIADAIKNGTPLPKGHGRLGDLGAFERFCTENEICNSALDGEPIVAIGQTSDGDNIWKPLFDYAPTIIERDKEGD